MKHVAVGDTHGRNVWQRIVDKEPCDKFVFIGDYFDSFDVSAEQQMENFKNICQFKRDNPEKVVMLIGNHDFHYRMLGLGDRYSGFQRAYQFSIQHLLVEAKDIMQMAYSYADVMFTHAGVSSAWLKHYDYSVGDIADWVNMLWKMNPMAFRFSDSDRTGFGEHPLQSPIWIRPAALYENRPENMIQVVGHTRVGRITPPQYSPGMWFIDTLEGDETKGFKNQYLVIEDGVFTIKNVNNDNGTVAQSDSHREEDQRNEAAPSTDAG